MIREAWYSFRAFVLNTLDSEESMLRAVIYNEINSIISGFHSFEPADFTVEVKSKPDGSNELQIAYRFEGDYSFRASIPKNRGTRGKDSYREEFWVTASASPGEMGSIQDFSYTGRDELMKGISTWLDRLHEELLAIPIHRKQAEQQRQLEDFLAQLNDLREEFFTAEEASALTEKLEKLEEQLLDNIRTSVRDQETREARISELHSEIEFLKSKIITHSKQSFAGVMFSRLNKWRKDPANQKLLGDTVQTATRELIGRIGGSE